MKQLKLIVLIGSALMVLAACNNTGLKKTKSGLLYKIISDGKGLQAKKGDYLKLTFSQKVRDSVLFSSAEGLPAYLRVDSSAPNYTLAEILTQLRKGDSAVVVQLADSIQRKSGQPLPPFIKKRDKIILTFRVVDLFKSMEDANKDRENEFAKQREKEVKTLEDYLAANKINVQKSPKGVYVVINTKGDGPAVDSGKQVSVRYSGKSFPDGKVFESNMTGPGNEPLKFVVGQHQIIEGWDDALRMFKKGGKGTLYIPAFLAYDAQMGPNHKPFENLIFDVEIVDVTDAPKIDNKALHPQPVAPRADTSKLQHARPQKK
ncbi:MAG TPA: FKBP-type peptidyl-prolyl cis-trans isomerase [Puia sp.]|nr:FKBP-type peptidyl-prolyl cis-trans isomerase [Puia sp.]